MLATNYFEINCELNGSCEVLYCVIAKQLLMRFHCSFRSRQQTTRQCTIGFWKRTFAWISETTYTHRLSLTLINRQHTHAPWGDGCPFLQKHFPSAATPILLSIIGSVPWLSLRMCAWDSEAETRDGVGTNASTDDDDVSVPLRQKNVRNKTREGRRQEDNGRKNSSRPLGFSQQL